MGNLTFKPLNDECDPFIHQLVQIGGDTGHLRHHANLQPDNKFFSVHVQPQQQTPPFFTYRKPVILHTMAVVAAISPRRMQPYDYMVPPSVLAQYLREARQVTFGQPFKLLHHLLSLLHRVETVHPKHDLDLDL